MLGGFIWSLVFGVLFAAEWHAVGKAMIAEAEAGANVFEPVRVDRRQFDLLQCVRREGEQCLLPCGRRWGELATTMLASLQADRFSMCIAAEWGCAVDAVAWKPKGSEQPATVGINLRVAEESAPMFQANVQWSIDNTTICRFAGQEAQTDQWPSAVTIEFSDGHQMQRQSVTQPDAIVMFRTFARAEGQFYCRRTAMKGQRVRAREKEIAHEPAD